MLAMPSKRVVAVALTAVAVTGGAGCGSRGAADTGAPRNAATTTTKPNGPASASTSVSIKSFLFSPGRVRVKPGTTVTWRNRDNVAHTVTASDKSFDSRDMNGGHSYSHRFDTPGTFTYDCTIHPSMTGTVVVEQ